MAIQGFLRRKSREQAQEQLSYAQVQFDGQNSDSPPKSLTGRQMALLRNAVAYPDRLEGGQGAALYGLSALPGSGTVWDAQQHPVTGRVLLARGDQLWLSSSAAMTAWDEVAGEWVVTNTAATIPPAVSNMRFRGLGPENTSIVSDQYVVYYKIVVDGFSAQFQIFSDAALSNEIAQADIETTAGVFDGDVLVVESGSSGVSGVIHWTTTVMPDPSDGIIYISQQTGLDGVSASEINFFGGDFFVFCIRGSTQSNIYVDQTIKKYFKVSVGAGFGYGSRPITPVDMGDVGLRLEYRYLYTFTRIVNAGTRIPDHTLNRLSGLLLLEGPANKYSIADGDLSDYSARQQSIVPPIDQDNPVTVPLYRDPGDGVLIPLAVSGLDAANPVATPAYITHISIYRTKNVWGVNDPEITNGNDPNEYVWVKDVPIYETSFQDDVSDDVLDAHASASQFLDSRGWVETLAGIGVIGPDFFMFSDGTSKYDYQASTRIQATGSLIGYHDARQRQITPTAVKAMTVTNTVYVALSEYKTMTSIAGVNSAGDPNAFTPLIQNFQVADEAIGLRAVGSLFRINASEFAALCSDGTVRVFNGTNWSPALDMGKAISNPYAAPTYPAGLVHKQVLMAGADAVIGYIRQTLLLFYTVDGAPRCLRYASDGTISGIGWSEVERDTYPWPTARPMQVTGTDAVQRLIVLDRENFLPYSVENPEDARQWDDDEPVVSWSATGTYAAHVSAITITGSLATLYGKYYPAGAGRWYLWTTAAGRDAGVQGDAAAYVDFLSTPGELVVIEQNDSGLGGTIVSDGTTLGGNSNLDAVFAYTRHGVDFSWVARPRELVARSQNNTSIHKESHLYYKAQPGEDLPEGLLISAQGIADEEAVIGADTSGIQPGGDIQFFIPVQGSGIQIEYSGNKSGLVITGMDTNYQTQDMRSENGPSNSPEAGYQAELEAHLTHYLAGQWIRLNRAKSVTEPSNYALAGDAPTLVADPSGRTQWGLLFAAGSYSQADTQQYNGLKLMIWVKGLAAGATILRIAGTNELLLAVGGADTGLVLSVGGVPIITLTGLTDPSEWTHIAITRAADSSTFKAYVNGVLADSGTSSVLVGGTTMTLLSVGALSDFRAGTAEASAATINYYYEDVELNGGQKVLPP